jgi:hypothetical protein
MPGGSRPLVAPVGVALEADRAEHLVDATVGMATRCRKHAQVVARAAPGMKRRVLEHRADGRAGVLELVVALAVEARRAGGRVDQPEQRAQRRALAGTVGSEKPRDTPRLDVEAEVLDRLDLAEALGEVADLDWSHRAASWRIASAGPGRRARGCPREGGV